MTRELKRKLAALRRKMKEVCDPLPPDLKEQRLAETADDDDAFARIYMPHLYRQEPSPYHQDTSEAMSARDNEIRGRGAPRNHAKTTRGIIHLARSVCHRKVNHVTTVSASREMAVELMEPLRISLSENSRIIQDFGDIVTRSSEGDFRTKDVRVTCRGKEQSLRGPRNDWIWCDDIETDQQARDRAQTDKLIDTVLEVLYNRLMPVSDGGGAFTITGTILSRKSMLARFLNINNAPDPEFPEIAKFGQLWRAIMTDEETDKQYALWPQRFSLKDLEKIKRRIGTRRFNKEYQNDPRDEDSIFQEDWIRGFHPVEFLELLKAV